MKRKNPKKKKKMKKALSDRRMTDDVFRRLKESKEKKKKVKHLREHIWRKLHQAQKRQTCQVITALNIACVLTKGKIVVPLDSDRFQWYVDLAGARFGVAISIEKVYEQLGIGVVKEYVTLWDCWDFPFELAVWHKAYGFHSVCVVDYEPRTDAYRIVNFDKATNLQGWIFAEDLQHFIKTPRKKPKEWLCRTFKLKPK